MLFGAPKKTKEKKKTISENLYIKNALKDIVNPERK
jgi:hypothetical protein